MQKKWFLIIVIILSTARSYAQQKTDLVCLDSSTVSYIFRVTDNKTNTKQQAYYYWFKSGRIHKTQGSYYGKLLHGNYKVLNREGALLEEGRYSNGEKVGVWRTWHGNGNIKSSWQRRLLAIRKAYNIREYDSTGNLIKKGIETRKGFSGYQIIQEENKSKKVAYKKGEMILTETNDASKN